MKIHVCLHFMDIRPNIMQFSFISARTKRDDVVY